MKVAGQVEQIWQELYYQKGECKEGDIFQGEVRGYEKKSLDVRNRVDV